MNPYVNFVLPKLRTVIKLFNDMTEEERNALRDNHHVFFYNFEDVVNLMDVMDDNAADARRRLAQAQREVAELDE